MGHAQRRKPARLAAKLREIRGRLGLSQAELCSRLGEEQFPLYNADISNFESGKREPSLIVLLRYSRLAEVSLEALIDDEIELPAER